MNLKASTAFALASPLISPRLALRKHVGSRQPPHQALRMTATQQPHTQSRPAKQKTFEKLPVGNAGLVLTEVCLGTMTWGNQNSEEEAHAQLDYAYERGVVGIDAAEMYPVPPTAETCGNTERFIQSWIAKRGGPAFRDNLVICSKVAGGTSTGRSFQWIRGGNRKVDRANIRAAVEGSLSRLGTDYIDLYQVHWPDRYVPLFGATAYDVASETQAVSFEEQISALDELIKEGKIRNYGLSNETAWGVSQYDSIARAKGLARPVSIQNSYSLIFRDFEGHVAEATSPSNAGLPLLAYSPLAGGALTGKYLRDDPPSGSRFTRFPTYMKRFRTSLAMEAIAEYEKIAKEAGLSLTQLSLAWCKSRWFIKSTIVGATSVSQLEENINTFAIDLDESVIAAVDKVYSRYRDPSVTS